MPAKPVDGGCRGTYRARGPNAMEITNEGNGKRLVTTNISHTIYQLSIGLQHLADNSIDGKIPCKRLTGAAGKFEGGRRRHRVYGSKLASSRGEPSFGCKSGNFPMTYLGISIHFRKLRNVDWKKVEERFEKRLSSWKGKHLSIGGHLTLINSVLSSLPLYMMSSFFAIPRGVLKKLDYFLSSFVFLAKR
jgi:hypothetical protein